MKGGWLRERCHISSLSFIRFITDLSEPSFKVGPKNYSHFVRFFSEFDLKLANIFWGCFFGHLTPDHKRIFNLVNFEIFFFFFEKRSSKSITSPLFSEMQRIIILTTMLSYGE